MEVKANGIKSRSIFGKEQSQIGEDKRESKADELEELQWSDDESDYIVRIPKLETPEPFDVVHIADQPNIVHIETHHEDYKRSKLYNSLAHGGDAIIHRPKPLLPRELRTPIYSSFRLPMPYIPQHVKESLGPDILEHLWFEFLQNDADESELIQIKRLGNVRKAMKKHLGYAIPLDQISFPGLDKDDLVDFKEVVLQLVLWGDQRQQLIQQFDTKEEVEVLGRCCAFDACTIKSAQALAAAQPKDRGRRILPQEDSEYKWDDSSDAKRDDHKSEVEDKGGSKEEESACEDDGEFEPEVHSLHVAWIRYKLEHSGTVRIKHICTLMDEVKIPYSKSRIPSSEWTIRGELLLTSPVEVQNLCERIRTDKDYERNKAVDDIYALPRWMESEFSPSEILLFKHHFKSIDVDGGGALDANELILLTANMGNQVTEEQAQGLIAMMDMDGSGTVDFSEFMMLMYKIQNGVIDLEGNMLAQAMVEAKSQISIFEEIEGLHSDPPPYAHVVNYGGNPVQCEIVIAGPPGTPYVDGTFKLRVILLNGYPFRTPDITFQTRIYHVNVLTEFDGLGYLPHMKHLWDSSWSLRRLIGHVVELLEKPRLDYIPIELVHIVKVFFWEEKEKRRIAEEARLAELARIAEIERLAELARIEAEEKEAARLLELEKLMLREMRGMAGEDRQNEEELKHMALEDVDADMKGADDNSSVATFASDARAAGLESDEKKGTDDADAKQTYEDDSDDERGDVKRTRRAASKCESKLDLAKVAGDAAPESKLSSRAADGMLEADSKPQGALSGRRGSKSGHATPRTGRSYKSSDEDRDTDDELPEEKAEPEESYPGLESQVMLKPLMRAEQMHLTTIQFFMGEMHRYEALIKEFVHKFALTTRHEKHVEEEPEEDEIAGDLVEALLVMQKEGFSYDEMRLSLSAEYGVRVSAGSISVWFHERAHHQEDQVVDLGFEGGDVEEKKQESDEDEDEGKKKVEDLTFDD